MIKCFELNTYTCTVWISAFFATSKRFESTVDQQRYLLQTMHVCFVNESDDTFITYCRQYTHYEAEWDKFCKFFDTFKKFSFWLTKFLINKIQQ